jgi:hypothetical protein
MVLIELTVSITAEGDRPASELSLNVGDFVPSPSLADQGIGPA